MHPKPLKIQSIKIGFVWQKSKKVFFFFPLSRTAKNPLFSHIKCHFIHVKVNKMLSFFTDLSGITKLLLIKILAKNVKYLEKCLQIALAKYENPFKMCLWHFYIRKKIDMICIPSIFHVLFYYA